MSSPYACTKLCGHHLHPVDHPRLPKSAQHIADDGVQDADAQIEPAVEAGPQGGELEVAPVVVLHEEEAIIIVCISRG